MALHPELDVLVSYCSMQGAEVGVDPGHGVQISWDTPLLEGYQWTYVPNRAIRPGLGHFGGLFNPGLWTLIRDGKFDAVLICGYYFASAWVAVCAAKAHGVPIIFVTDSHGLRSWNTRSSWKLWIKKRVLGRIFSLAKSVVVSSTGGIQYLTSLGYPAGRAVLAPTSVDNDWWIAQYSRTDRDTARERFGLPRNALIVLYCGTLQPWKAPKDLLESFAFANIPNSLLVFAGDGPQRPELQKRASEQGLHERVRFLGFLNQSQLPAVYKAADLFVLPSLFDAFGLVINEAMLCGLPVVVSDRVGARYDLVKPNENGYVFPVGDVRALAAILKDVLRDDEKRTRMGEEAKRRMATWSPHEYVGGIVRAVDVAIAQSNTSPPNSRECDSQMNPGLKK